MPTTMAWGTNVTMTLMGTASRMLRWLLDVLPLPVPWQLLPYPITLSPLATGSSQGRAPELHVREA